MHFTTPLLTALLATTAIATPTGYWVHKNNNNDRNKHWTEKWNHNDYKHEKVFTFDKTFVVKAEPSQVRNGTVPAPGQPGAKGLFKYGINVEENTICYVSPPLPTPPLQLNYDCLIRMNRTSPSPA
jgi:hypothetical protein